MKTKTIQEKLKLHKKWLCGEEGGKCADFQGADLHGANLQGADFRSANLWGANLQGANLQCAGLQDADFRSANLWSADLRNADLQDANLWGANLQDADLRDANLQNVDLRDADLRNADLDFSCWPLWCGSKDVKIDDRIFWQLCDHLLATNTSGCGKEVARVKKYLTRYGKRSHRARALELTVLHEHPKDE